MKATKTLELINANEQAFLDAVATHTHKVQTDKRDVYHFLAIETDGSYSHMHETNSNTSWPGSTMEVLSTLKAYGNDAISQATYEVMDNDLAEETAESIIAILEQAQGLELLAEDYAKNNLDNEDKN